MSHKNNYSLPNLRLPEGNGNTTLKFVDEHGRTVKVLEPTEQPQQTISFGAAIGKIAKAGKPNGN